MAEQMIPFEEMDLVKGKEWVEVALKSLPNIPNPALVPLPPVLQSPILLMSSSTTQLKISACGPDLRKLGAGVSDVTPPCRPRRNQRSKSALRWMKSWVMSQICYQILPISLAEGTAPK